MSTDDINEKASKPFSSSDFVKRTEELQALSEGVEHENWQAERRERKALEAENLRAHTANNIAGKAYYENRTKLDSERISYDDKFLRMVEEQTRAMRSIAAALERAFPPKGEWSVKIDDV